MESPVWETCEIMSEQRPGGYWFHGNAVGSSGRYTAGVSPVFSESPYEPSKKSQAALDSLIATLAGDGWESLGRSGTWYGYRFRRLVASAGSSTGGSGQTASRAREQAKFQIAEKERRQGVQSSAVKLIVVGIVACLLFCVVGFAANSVIAWLFIPAVAVALFGIVRYYRA